MKRTVVLGLLLFGCLASARSQDSAVTAELSLEQNQLLPDEKMYLKLTLHNRAGQDLKLGVDSDWITFTVAGEKNDLAPQIGTGHVPIDGEFTLPAGLYGSREFNLTPYFDFRQPGRYTVRASIKIPQWQQVVAVQPATFTVVKGTPLSNLPEMAVGVRLLNAESNQPPEIRKFSLEKSEATAGGKLYVRLTDATGGRTLRLVPVGNFFAFSQPDVKLDRYNNLHVLHQTDAKAFTYCVIDTQGMIVERQTYQYVDRRPALREGSNGMVDVAGGSRVISANDLPPDQPAESAPSSNGIFPGSKP
jgi:hypothetical protein